MIMRNTFIIISGLMFISLSSYGQVFKMVLNQPEPLQISTGNDTIICKNHSVILGGNPSASGGTEEYYYMWSPIDGLDDPTSANPMASPTESTKYVLTITDSNGCHTVDFIDVTIDVCLGIEDGLLSNNLSIYPNPSYGTVFINGLPLDGHNLKGHSGQGGNGK